MIKPLWASVSALALLAGCAGETPSNLVASGEANGVEASPPAPASANAVVANSAEPAGIALNLAPDELTLMLPGGSARHVPFGMDKGAATQMIAASLGSPIEQSTNPECGAGPLDYAAFRDGLSLYFQDGKFAGWDLDGRENGKFSTANGIRIGMTRDKLKAAGPVSIEESSLGQEFRMGEMSGLLSSSTAEAEVTNLWAGVTCIAR